MAELIKMCTVRAVDSSLRDEAKLKALEENPLNAGTPDIFEDATEAAIEKFKKWKNGRTLRVKFLDGDPAIQAKVQAVAEEWMEHVNLKFDFGDHEKAEIRISFKQPGSWSYIGTDALLIVGDQPTMNYGWFTADTSDEEYHRVVLHEFGHAIGFIHEHQNPEQGINWNVQAVYDYYMGPPNNWSKSQTDFNLLQKYNQEMLELTVFDPESIMLYPVPKEFTTDGFEVKWQNHKLSALDLELAGRVYPFDDADVTAAVTDKRS